MIFRNIGILGDDPVAFFVFTGMLLLAVVASVTFHEFSHALTATSLGDDTARRLGRLSLNPKAHLDPAGSIMFLLAGFGWGKPVPVNGNAFGANALKAMMLVAFAGPLSNFVLAFLIGLLFKLGIVEWPYNVIFTPLQSGAPVSLVIGQFFAMWLFLNLILGVFNLIPLAPLDGSKVAAGLLAIIVGSLGIHKFYLGYSKQGLIMLLVSVLLFFLVFPFVIMAFIALIEGILYLTMSDEQFDRTYVQGRKPWF